MGKLKLGWRRVKFGEVVRQVKDKVDPETAGVERYVAGEHMDTDDLRIRRWGEVGDGYLGPAFHMRFKPGQVLYGSRRTYLRKVAVAEFEGICANTTFVLESADPQKLLPELLPFLMQTEGFHEHSKRESKGSVNPYVNFSDVAWYEFALPPLETQRRMSQLLAATAAAWSSYDDAYRRADDLLASFRHQRASGFEKLYLSKRVEELSTLVTKGESPRWQGFEYCDEGVRFITSENVLDEHLSLSPSKFLPHAFGVKLARSSLMAGDILINIVGGSIGRFCKVPEGLDGSNINQAVALVRPDSRRIIPDYLFEILLAPSLKHRLCSRKVDDYKPNLSLSSIRNFSLPMPPRTVQEDFLREVNELRGASTSLEKRRNTLDALRASFIARAFAHEET